MTDLNSRPSSRRFALIGAAAVVAAGIIGITAVVANRDESPSGDSSVTTTVASTTTPPSSSTTSVPTTTEPPSTTQAPTTTSILPGTRANPIRGSLGLAGADWSSAKFGVLEPDNGLVTVPPPDGRVWMRTLVVARRLAPTPGKASSLSEMLQVIGDRASYASQPLEGTELDLLADQPDATSGQTVTGYVYFAVDPSDTNLLLAVFGLGEPVFITPGG